MTVYLALIFWYFICHLIIKKVRWLELLFDVVPTILIVGMRNRMVGADTNMYASFFESLKYSTHYGGYSVLDQQHFGTTFTVATQFLSHVFSTYHGYLLICAMLCILPLAYIAFNEKYNLWLFFSLYVLVNGLAGSMNILRQALALTFSYSGVYFWIKKKYVVAIVLMFVGVLIHPSTLVVPGVLLVSNFVKFKIGYVLLGIPIGLVLFFAYTPLLNIFTTYFPAYGYYTSSYAISMYSGGALGAILQFFVTLAFIVLIYFGYRYVGDGDNTDSIQGFDGDVEEQLGANDSERLLNIALWLLLFSLAFSLMTLKFSQVSRIAYELNLIVIWAVPSSIKFATNSNYRLILMLLAIILGIAYFLAIQIFRPEWYGIVPYIFGG